MTDHKLRVFLCHPSNDKPAMRELYQRLKQEGWIDPWLDEENLYPGQDWDLEIEKAVEAADAVIVFLSNNSVSKEGYVQRELRFVLRIADFKPEGTVFVIPVRLDDCPLPRRLSMWQYVEYFPQDRKDWAYQRLLGGLKVRASKLDISVINSAKEQTRREMEEKTKREKEEQARRKKVAREKAEAEYRPSMRNQVFFSYSHKDKEWLEKLKIWLRPILPSNMLWDDTKIDSDTKWEEEIQKSLESAKVGVLLVSQNFFASDFIQKNELPLLLKAAEEERLNILWIPIAHSTYAHTKIAQFQAVHDPSRPLNSLRGASLEKALAANCNKIMAATE